MSGDLMAEQAVLAAAMVSTVARKRAYAVIRAEDFDSPQHVNIWRAIQRLDHHGKPVDPVTVSAVVASDRMTAGVMLDLATAFASPDQVEHHAAIVKNRAVKRRLAITARQVIQQAENPDLAAEGFAAAVVTRFAAIRDGGVAHEVTARTLAELTTSEDEPYDWVIPSLLERSDRFVLTGVEGLGKSVLLRQLAIFAAAGVHPFEGTRFEPCKAVIIDAENTERHVKRKVRSLHAIAARRGIDPGERVLIDCPSRIDITRDRDLSHIHQLLDAMQPDIVVIGPLYRLVPRAVQTDDEAAPLLTALDTIRDRGVALLLEAHAGHTIGRGGQRDMRPRGSSALLGWPEFGYGMCESDNPEHVALTPWRGDRDERCWPRRLQRGGQWPWTPVSDLREAS